MFCNLADRPKISAQIVNFWRVRLQKQPDAWPEGVPLPLAFPCYATKVLCPPSMVLELGTRMAVKPGCFAIWLTDPKSQPKSATLGGCNSRNNLMPGWRAFRSHLPLLVMSQRCSVLHGIGIGGQDGCQARVLLLQSDRPKTSAQIGNFWRVRLQKRFITHCLWV